MSVVRPTFLIIGAMKAGTTSLAAYLKAHPQVCMSRDKEPHYFTRHHERGMAGYLGLFQHCEGVVAVGEASTSYTMVPHEEPVAARIAEWFPEMRMVYLVREPLSRIRSHYVHNVDRALESRPIDRAVREDPRYLDTTRYGDQLSRYLEHFPSEQILVFDSQRLRLDRVRMLAEVFDFIGVDPTIPIPSIERELNQSSEKRLTPFPMQLVRRALRWTGANRLFPKSVRQRLRTAMSVEMPSEVGRMSAATEAWIKDSLATDMQLLRELTGLDLRSWDDASRGA